MLHGHGNTGSWGRFLMSLNLLSSYVHVKKIHSLVNGFALVLIVTKVNDNAEMTFFCGICYFNSNL